MVPYSPETVYKVFNRYGHDDLMQDLYVLYYKCIDKTSRYFIWQVINWTTKVVNKELRRVEYSSSKLIEYKNYLDGAITPEHYLTLFDNLLLLLLNNSKCLEGFSTIDRYMIYLAAQGLSVRQIAAKIMIKKSYTAKVLRMNLDILGKELGY